MGVTYQNWLDRQLIKHAQKYDPGDVYCEKLHFSLSIGVWTLFGCISQNLSCIMLD